MHSGKYQLVRKLATGGMAEVFLAKRVSFAGEGLACAHELRVSAVDGPSGAFKLDVGPSQDR
jgi:serine/threonine protein kinase